MWAKSRGIEVGRPRTIKGGSVLKSREWGGVDAWPLTVTWWGMVFPWYRGFHCPTAVHCSLLITHSLMYSHNDFSLISAFHPIMVFCEPSNFRPINVIFLLHVWLSEPFTKVISHLETISEPKNVRSHHITCLQSGSFHHVRSWHPKGLSVSLFYKKQIYPEHQEKRKGGLLLIAVFHILMFLHCVLDFTAQLQLFGGEDQLELEGQTFGKVPKFSIMLDLWYVLSKTMG